VEPEVLAVDIGGSKLMLGCVDAAGHVLEKRIVPLEGAVTPRDVTEAAAQGAKELDLSGVCAVGLNVPGLADTEKGLWVHAPFSGISDFPIADVFSALFSLPAAVENDVNACALAEKRFGLCKHIDHFLWITISNGIGGSLFLNGRLYSGSAGNAGEIGHFIVEETNGFPCGCGKRGCLEAQAAGPAIARLYGLLSGKPIPPGMRSREVGELAAAGDRAALAAFEKAGYYIGKALAYAANFVNPKIVVLGGGVMLNKELLMPSVERHFQAFLFERANKDIKIVQTALGYDAALLGAASVALASQRI